MIALKIHTLLVALHLFGLALGFGAALAADLIVARTIWTKRTFQNWIDIAGWLSALVSFGLIILWISGIALAIELVIDSPRFLTNGKFWAKVAIVLVLTINGVNIHRNVLPMLRAANGQILLAQATTEQLLRWAFTGSVSALSWIVPTILGCAREWSYTMPFSVIIQAYVLAVLTLTSIVYFLLCVTADLKANRSPSSTQLESAGLN